MTGLVCHAERASSVANKGYPSKTGNTTPPPLPTPPARSLRCQTRPPTSQPPHSPDSSPPHLLSSVPYLPRHQCQESRRLVRLAGGRLPPSPATPPAWLPGLLPTLTR